MELKMLLETLGFPLLCAMPLIVVWQWRWFFMVAKKLRIVDRKQLIENEREWRRYFRNIPYCRSSETRESLGLVMRLRSHDQRVVQQAIQEAKATGYWDHYSTDASEHGLFSSWNNISEVAVAELISNGARVRRYGIKFSPATFNCKTNDGLRRVHLQSLLNVGCELNDKDIDGLTLAGKICADCSFYSNVEQISDDLLWLIEQGACIADVPTRIEVLKFIAKLPDGEKKDKIQGALADQTTAMLDADTVSATAITRVVRL
ncbi:hypothetical protein [Novilysobacter arseniciresistens]|uniref:hypothetical protein n=1 Tax=Novilysobacter arseniciresistens TaxID=1385522 RepID=UPI00126A62F8|nr:hypothetical protein [Lysobacter arseniciresistens]